MKGEVYDHIPQSDLKKEEIRLEAEMNKDMKDYNSSELSYDKDKIDHMLKNSDVVDTEVQGALH